MSCMSEEIQAPARVIGIAAGQVELAVSRQSACRACAEKSRCGNAQEEGREQHLWLPQTEAIKIGSQVAVSLPATSLWRAAAISYGLPLGGFLLGLLCGAPLSDVAASGAALLGLACGFALSAQCSRRWISPLRLTPLDSPTPSGAHHHD